MIETVPAPKSAANRKLAYPFTSAEVSGFRSNVSVPEVVALLQGIVLVPVVAWDGSAQWRIVRAIAVVATTALVVGLQRLGSSRLASFSAWAWGATGVAVGIGIGAAHIVKAGPSIYSALALIALVTGLIASARTLLGLAHDRPGWRRLLLAPAGLTALILLYYPATAALIATNTPRVDIGIGRPSDLGLAYEEVEFSAPDGVLLSGWFMPGAIGSAVVLLHGGGASSNRTAVLAHARVLVENGYNVLAFDARGHGRSDGDGMEWGWYGDLDVAGALDFLESRREVDPSRIAAVGLSMGGEQAITAAASDSRVKAVVAEGATNRVLGDDDAFLPNHPGRWVNIVADWIKYGIADWISGAEPPMPLTSAVVAVSPRPILLITAGTVDDERRAAYNFRAASPSSVRVWNVVKATHTSGLATAPTEWETLVIGFLGEALAS